MKLIKIVLILIVQLLITYFVMTKTNIQINNYLLYLSHLTVGLIIMFIPLPFFIKLFLMFIFTFLAGVMYSKFGIQNVIKIFLETFLILITMMLISLGLMYMNITLGERSGIIIFMAITSLFIFGLVTLFDPITYNKKYYAISIIILFSFFIIYDTHYLLLRNQSILSSSFDYYLDIVNIAVQLSILKKSL